MTVRIYGGHCLCGAVRFEAQGAPVSANAGFQSTKVK
jgi:hypothetical protein